MMILHFIRFHVIFYIVAVSNCENITLFCDSWSQVIDTSETYCTITNLRLTHSQRVTGPRMNSLVEFLKFYDSSLLYIPPVIFTEFQMLRNLDVSDSDITDIPRNTFSSAYNLVWLNASYNGLPAITGSVFVGADNLLDLDLSHCAIERLHLFSFHGLGKLVNLDLSRNLIVDVSAQLFSDNTMLQMVNLRGNRIDSISPQVFDKQKQLEEVDLAENMLTQLDPDTFKNSFNLRYLTLTRNNLTELNLNVGDMFHSLRAEENSLMSVSITCRSSASTIPCTLLDKLRLSYNKLNSLVNITELSSLGELSLSNNQVGRLNISTFSKLKKLELLDLKNTSLSGLTFGTFRSQIKLKYLDISDNNLQNLNLDIFLPYMYRSLQELYLAGNNLSRIEGRHTFEAFSSLRKLGLARNRFNCSYLLHLITIPHNEESVEFPVDIIGDDTPSENVHGIECSHSENSSSNTHSNLWHRSEAISTTKQSQHYKESLDKMILHEKQLEQHLLLMRAFVILVAVLGLCAVLIKIVQYFTRNRSSWINTISYRSTNTIQSEIDAR